ncbi:hypothetical protein D3C80_1902210 [compost metagenome]
MFGTDARRLQMHTDGVGQRRAHAVTKQPQRAGGQTQQRLGNTFGQTGQTPNMCFVEPLFTSGILHGQEVDIPRQMRQPRAKKTRAASSVWQAHQAGPGVFSFT